ncbi:MAG: cyclic nucleotide-binding domain-containing protein [Oceanococcaceae bacterium]
MSESIALPAFGFGLLSAASLPLGALAARFWSPGNRVIAAMMAFGAGALLAALTIDLVAVALNRGEYLPLASGCLIGGLLFVGLNQILNSQGGFLRKAGTTITYLRRGKSRNFKRIFKRLSQSPVFIEMPPEQVSALIPHFSYREFDAGDTLLAQGDPGDFLLIIDRGEVAVATGSAEALATLGADDVLGEMALVTGAPRSATATAQSPVGAWVLPRDAFNTLLRELPEFAASMRKLTAARLRDLKSRDALDHERAERWFAEAGRQIDDASLTPTAADVKQAVATHGGAPLAIWLGILLDGIPESFVIGSSMVHATVSLSLIAGLFLSNFPEAFSSSLGMREQNYSYGRIMLMWSSLTLITGLGAWAGSIFFVGASHSTFSLVEGIAAGAMLTVIAETMLPEAYHRGGAITGFATLLGFLAALFFTTL